MNSYIARQPIFDRKVKIFAYELLFRSHDKQKAFVEVDADLASSRVVMESFHTMGLETVTAGRPAFINFTPNLLLQNIATLFPKDLLVIELLETIEPTPEIIGVCRSLYEKGYTLALDDFIYRPELMPLIDICRIIKFDFLMSSIDEIQNALSMFDAGGKILLAEKIENEAMFEKAANMGFHLFQGFFFSKPVTLVAKEVAPLQIHYTSLLKEVAQGEDMDFNRLAKIIRGDLALSYKLLRLANSAYFGLRGEVADIKHALAVLGAKEIRKWAYLMAMIGLSAHKPDELVRMSMLRGRFMEQISALCPHPVNPENAFLTGLFSLIDALTDRPMSEALESVVLAPEIRAALAEYAGPLANLLLLAISLERGHWETTDKLAGILAIDSRQITQTYLDAVAWCDEMPSV